jgi:hypothetical protein
VRAPRGARLAAALRARAGRGARAVPRLELAPKEAHVARGGARKGEVAVLGAVVVREVLPRFLASGAGARYVEERVLSLGLPRWTVPQIARQIQLLGAMLERTAV